MLIGGAGAAGGAGWELGRWLGGPGYGSAYGPGDYAGGGVSAAVPEPASALLLTAAISLFVLLVRR